jgi:hypothetical protein
VNRNRRLMSKEDPDVCEAVRSLLADEGIDILLNARMKRVSGKSGDRVNRRELDCWMKTLPQPRTVTMEATIFSGWIYDHLLPHATQIKVAHPLMLRAIAAAKKKNDQIDASKLADCLRCDFLPECHMIPEELRDRRRTLRYRHLLVRCR